MFIADAEGNLVFFNEAAEGLLGRSFAEAGELSADEWAALFSTEELDGTPMALEAMPAGVALIERRPAHHTFHITGLDRVKRRISVTAFPLFERAQEFDGVVAIFWEQPDEG